MPAFCSHRSRFRGGHWICRRSGGTSESSFVRISEITSMCSGSQPKWRPRSNPVVQTPSSIGRFRQGKQLLSSRANSDLFGRSLWKPILTSFVPAQPCSSPRSMWPEQFRTAGKVRRLVSPEGVALSNLETQFGHSCPTAVRRARIPAGWQYHAMGVCRRHEKAQ